MSDAEAEHVAPDPESQPAPLPTTEAPQPPAPKSTIVFLPKPAKARKNSSSSASSASSSEDESEVNVQSVTCIVNLTKKSANVAAVAETQLSADQGKKEAENSPAEARLVKRTDLSAEGPTKEELLDQNIEKLRLERKEKSPSPQGAAIAKHDDAKREETLKDILASIEPFEIKNINDSEAVLEPQEGIPKLGGELKTTNEELGEGGGVQDSSAAATEPSGDSAIKAPDVQTVREETREITRTTESSVLEIPKTEPAAQIASSERADESKKVQSPPDVRESVPAPSQADNDQQATFTPSVAVTPSQPAKSERKEEPSPIKIEAVTSPLQQQQPAVEKAAAAPVLLPESPKKSAPTPPLRQNERPVDVVIQLKPKPRQQIEKREEIEIDKGTAKAEAKPAGGAPLKKTDETAQSSTADASSAEKLDDKPATRKKRKCNIL